ncbi:MAG: M28 family peptidase, partial [Candidatus Thermoplasmatota archaeon]|nr:M28 family peptidase [Candidatus Thermoplasmatota archaeon]
ILNYPAIIHGGNLRTKLVINSRNLTFYNNQLNTNTYIEEFYISPRWNLTGQYLYNHTYRTDCLANDLQQLSHTFTEHYLNIKTDIPNYTKWVIDFFENYTTEFKNLTVDYINNDITDDMAFWTDFFVPTFEDHYDFKIDDINISDNTTFPTFYRDIVPETDAFVYIEEDQQYNPNKSDTISDKIQNTLRELFNDTYWAIFQEKLSHFPNILPNVRKTLYLLWYKLVTKTITTLFTDQWGKFRTVLLAKLQPKWRGFIRYDFHPHAYDMNYVPYRAMPIIWINGTIGTTINENASQYRVNYTLEQYYDTAAISYNVIGQINGSDPTKTMIISTLMDSWWNQGTADSAIGMGIVLALAKYMKELTEPPYNLIPRYNIKFIAFSGEEYGLRGAHYYQKIYKTQFNEDIVLVLDLNQLGFKQPDDREEPDPDLTMHVQTNKILNRLLLEKVCGNTNYVARLNDDRTHMSKIDYTSLGTFPSNAFAFLLPPELLTTTTVLFLKEKSNWTMHHRDGEDHEEGDVMDYFYWDDVNLTAEMIWNATKLYAFNPNCWFTDTTFVEWDDTDEDSFPDTINASITMRTVMPRDHLVLKGFLNHVNFQFNNIYTEQQTKDYVIERGEDITDYMNFTLDDPGAMGWYTCAIYVFNSTGEALNYGCNGFDFPIFWPVFANQSAYKTKVYVTAFNTAPGITSQPTSTVTVNPKAGVSYHYTSSTTDIEGDAIYYQWMFTNTATGETSYSPWMGPYQSGENCTVDHRWTTAGPKQVMVRARDEHLSPNIMSNWSTPLNLTLQNGVRIIAPEKVLVNKSFNVSGIAYGFTPQNFTWTFDQSEGGIKYENATNYIYDNKINQTISLSVKYNDTTWYSTEETVEVVSLLPQLTVSSMYVQSGENIIFINISKSEFSITNISWDFGDGNSSTDTMCNHSYAKPGVYTVTLMVND